MALPSTANRYYQTIAPYYDLELADRGDVGFWLALARQRLPRTVLDLGAGTGRIALPLARLLAQQGGIVHALDASASMLDCARAKAQRSPRTGWPQRLQLVQADMRCFRRDDLYDLVIAADDPFAHLVDDADVVKVLTCVARCLAPDGLFIVETPIHQRQVKADRRGAPMRHARTREVRRANRRLAVTMAQTFAPGAATSAVEVRYRLSDADEAPLGEAQGSFEARVHRPGDLEALLAAANFQVVERWGSFRFGPYDPATGDLRILAARPDAS